MHAQIGIINHPHYKIYYSRNVYILKHKVQSIQKGVQLPIIHSSVHLSPAPSSALNEYEIRKEKEY